MLPDQVIFEIEVQEGKTWEGGVTSAELEEAEPTRIMMTDDGIGGLLLLDETGQYCVENSSMRRWIRMPKFWNDSSPSYEADTALLEESASETDTPEAETTSSPISYEGAEEVLQIAEQNSKTYSRLIPVYMMFRRQRRAICFLSSCWFPSSLIRILWKAKRMGM